MISRRAYIELDEPLDRQDGIRRIEGFFEPGTGISSQAELRGRPTNRRRVEVRRFEQQGNGRFRHFGFETSHYPGEGDGLTRALNHQRVRGEDPLGSVEGPEALALLGPVDLDAAHLGRVEGVHGLAEIRHDVIGEIHQPGDRPHPHVAKAQLHPHGGRLHGYALQNDAAVTPTSVRVGN